MSDNPFTDWRRYALRYADPAYATDWQAGPPPHWPGAIQNERFRAWTGERLAELELRIFAEHPASKGRHFSPAEWATALMGAVPPEVLRGFLRDYKSAQYVATRGDSAPSVEQTLKTLIRMNDPDGKRRGPTALPELRALEPAGLAGWDIWTMRKIILPRFWPEQAASEFHLAKCELAKIAASRRGCTPRQAERFYVDERLASF